MAKTKPFAEGMQLASRGTGFGSSGQVSHQGLASA